MKVSIAGASGYVGGELLRILLGHPGVEVFQVTSQSHAGKPVTSVHPNLRKRTSLRFCRLEDLEPCDALFVALPHGEVAPRVDWLLGLAPRLIDMSADFRLRNPDDYPRWYGFQHPCPKLLGSFVYGIPELHREELKGASRVAVAGCMAGAAILAVAPLFRQGLVDPMVIVEGKFGSSAGGNQPSTGSHHSERSHVTRTYAPTGHRHTAEIVQELSFDLVPQVHVTASSVDMVRGVMVTCHIFLRQELGDRDIWELYRCAYGAEPFVRLVAERYGVHRFPDPKVLAGSNFCDIGFQKDPFSRRLVVMSAIDNLVKGAAGNAVQCFNIMFGYPETWGLEFPGLHP
ncbi:MAG: N-acetyl-gamma-glutamyl-phosphate reductase [Bacillota bacterium]